MVVMAIIAILATAGLSAYTGYIKKARDTKRMADLSAMNTIIVWSLSTNGNVPTASEFIDLVKSMNNGKMLSDPIWTSTCYYGYIDTDGGVTDGFDQFDPGMSLCTYSYFDTCPAGEYAIATWFESESNLWKFTQIPGTGTTLYQYWLGNCTDKDYVTP